MRIKYIFSSRRTGRARMGDRTQKEKIPSMVKKMIEISDVVLEVLDARFIEKTRNMEMENYVKEKGKMIIYVVNKSDLANIDEIKSSLNKDLYPYVLVSTKLRRGISDLRERIKIEVKRLKIDETKGYRRAQVCVIGYPNTGKSSLINVLSGTGSAKASPTAGYTKGIQRIRLTKDILILDSPGVIPDDESLNTEAGNIKKHAEIGVKMFDKVKDPDLVVAHLVKEYRNVFDKFYGIDSNGDAEKLLFELGSKMKLLKKGGEVDLDRTARIILKDWQKGKIKHS